MIGLSVTELISVFIICKIYMDIIRDITSFKLSNEAFETILKATLLLVLSVSGNFLAETLGCQSQKVLGNMFVKHILILLLLSKNRTERKKRATPGPF